MSLLTEIASRIKTKIETFSISLSQIADGLITGAKLVANTVTFSKTQQIANNKILGNIAGSTANIAELDIANYKNALIPLTTTYADCENTADEIDVVTVTIPANSLEDGDIIQIIVNHERLQNSGGNITFYQKLQANSTNFYSLNTTLADAVSTFKSTQKHTIHVTNLSGNNVDLLTSGSSLSSPIYDTSWVNLVVSNLGTLTNANSKTASSIDKTSTITIKLTAKWLTSNVNAWIRIKSAQAYIIKKL